MKQFLPTILLSILLVQFTVTKAQIDTSFWFAAPWVTPDHTERHNVVVHLSTFGAPSTTVHLRQPAAIAPNRYDTVLVIGPNQTFDYIFWRDKLAAGPPSTTIPNVGFDSLETRPADVVVPYGLYISSSSNITVVYDVICQPPGYNNPETFCLMGQNALGLEFLCPQQTLYRNRTLTDRSNTPVGVLQPKQQITIVASMPNTVVWITPKCNVVGHLANITYSVLLPNAGSSYNIENAVQNTYLPGNNLSGTLVTADKPIAITVADDSLNNIHSSLAESGASTWGGMGCYDLIGDQIVPVNVVGKDYIINRGHLYRENELGAGNPGMKESAFIVATQNLTQLTIVAGTTTTTASLNKGDTYVDTLTTDLSYVHADKSVYVYHVSGLGCELGSAIIPPLNCAGSNMVAFSRNQPYKFALNILCKNGSQNTFTLNGSTSLVPASAFTIVPATATLQGGPFFGAQIDLYSTSILPIGSYTIGNNTDEFALGVFDGDLSSGGLYHYLSSFMNRVDVKTSTLNPLCVSSVNTVALTGTVSGAASTGIWTSANGTGTFSPVYTSTSNIISTSYTLSNLDTTKSFLKFYLISAGTCRPISDSVTIMINHQPIISVSNNVTLCRNNLSPVSLSGTFTNAIGAQWSGGNGGTFTGSGSSVVYSLSIADVSATAIVFTLASNGPLPGCSNSAKTLTVNFIDPPAVNSGSDVIICGKTIPGVGLYGNVSGLTTTGIWSGPGTGTFLPSAGSSTVSYLFSPADYLITTFVFTLTSTNNGLCASVNDVIQVLRDTSTVNIYASSHAICIHQSATLTAMGTPTVVWSTTSTSSLLVISPTLSTSYSVTGTTTLNCNYTDIVTIVVNPLPNVTASTSNTDICLGESLILNASGATSYTWTTIPAFTSSVIVSPTLATIYYLVGTDLMGCNNGDSVSVSILECTGINEREEDFLLIYPNPTTGEFIIQSQQKISLRIINQLGQLVKTIELNQENQHKLCISDLANGVYFVIGTATGDKKIIRQKIVIDK